MSSVVALVGLRTQVAFLMDEAEWTPDDSVVIITIIIVVINNNRVVVINLISLIVCGWLALLLGVELCCFVVFEKVLFFFNSNNGTRQ